MKQTLLADFCTVTEQGHHIYQHYMNHGKVFLDAKRLFENNIKKKHILTKLETLGDADINAACHSLVEHISAWQSQWKALESSLNPLDSDEFVFISQVPYPKHSETFLYDLSGG